MTESSGWYFRLAFFVGFTDPHDPLHAVQLGELLLIQRARVAFRAQDGGLCALGHHDTYAARLHGVYGGFQLFGGELPLHNDYHLRFAPLCSVPSE